MSTPGSVYRFDDRDVRDNPGYYAVAEEYLQGYTGEFSYLIDMKMRVASGLDLSTGMVRGVLNCMRNDPRVTVPEPQELTEDRPKLAVVTELRPEKAECPMLGTDHGPHWFPDGRGKTHCIGEWRLTREIRTARARFHPPYVRGKSSNLIHRSAHEGEITWFPDNFHREGPSRVVFWSVGVRCPIKGLKNPELLNAEGVRAARPKEAPTQNEKYPEVTLCPRCFPGTEGVKL